MRQFVLPRGPLGWVVLALTASIGLFVVFWLITTVWILALGAGVLGALTYGWRRLETRLRPNRWRRLPPGR